MSKLKIDQALSNQYHRTRHLVVEIKKYVTGLCGNIERFFRLKFGLDLRRQITEEEMAKVVEVYPYLKDMTLDQFNRLILVFTCIRDVNAHMSSCKPVFLDDDLLEYCTRYIEPLYVVKIRKEITVYGQIYILCFLADDGMLHPFFDTVFASKTLAIPIEDTNGYVEYIHAFCKHHILSERDLFEMPIHPVQNLSGSDIVNINNLCFRKLSNVLFELESELDHSKPTSERRTFNIKFLTKRSPLFAEHPDTIHKIVTLRNLWCHGFWLGDEYETEEGTIIYQLETILETLKEIKDCIKDELPKTKEAIDDFAEALFGTFISRPIELTYKILDIDLFDPEKLEQRMDKLSSNIERLKRLEPSIYESLLELQDDGKFSIANVKHKFKDGRKREWLSDKLVVYIIHSPSGIIVENTCTSQTELCLMDVDIPDNKQVMINGGKLSNFPVTRREQYGQVIEFVYCEIK